MKNSVLAATILTCVLSFGASNAFAAKTCTIDYYGDDGYCKCKVDDRVVDLRGGYPTKDGCAKACGTFCGTPDIKPAPAPVIDPALEL